MPKGIDNKNEKQYFYTMSLPIDLDKKTMDLTLPERYQHILSFKDFVGFKNIKNIKERYRIDQILGEGSFGTVRKGFHLHAQIDTAIKFIRKKDIKSDGQKKNLQNEMELLESLNHPGIMQIYELLHDEENYYIVSELVTDGTLFDYLIEQTETKYGAIPEANAKILIRQILYALNYMH